MKNILWIAALLIHTAGAAQADMISFAQNEGRDPFVRQYTLDSFKVASESSLLRGPAQVVRGTVELDGAHNELRLQLFSRNTCPTGAICATVMPVPVSLTLPIRHIAPRVCGGFTVVAEQSIPSVNGSFVRVELTDDNGGSGNCGNADDVTFVKRVKVQLTEENESRQEAISVFSGLPMDR